MIKATFTNAMSYNLSHEKQTAVVSALAEGNAILRWTPKFGPGVKL